MLEQGKRIPGSGILAQHQHCDPLVILPDPGGGLDTLIGAGRRHPDVGNDHVGHLLTDDGKQLRQVGRRPDQLEVVVGRNQAGDALPEEHMVLGQYDADFPHSGSDRSAPRPPNATGCRAIREQ